MSEENNTKLNNVYAVLVDRDVVMYTKNWQEADFVYECHVKKGSKKVELQLQNDPYGIGHSYDHKTLKIHLETEKKSE